MAFKAMLSNEEKLARRVGDRRLRAEGATTQESADEG
jgi:hypothetical protein